MEYNIIGDIAGQYEPFIELIEKMPKAKIIAVGDAIDRGPDSSKVIQWFMDHPEHELIFGNHEHMCCQYYNRKYKLGYKRTWYSQDVWRFYNGGSCTLASYPGKEVPIEHVKWMSERPWFLDLPEAGLFISHAPLMPGLTLEEACDLELLYTKYSIEDSILWNRTTPPNPMEGRVQIFGHLGCEGGKSYSKDGINVFAICVDNSARGELLGLHWPSKTWYGESHPLRY